MYILSGIVDLFFPLRHLFQWLQKNECAAFCPFTTLHIGLNMGVNVHIVRSTHMGGELGLEVRQGGAPLSTPSLGLGRYA